MRRTPRHKCRPDRPRPAARRWRGPWKFGPIPVVGLIGGIGAGKSRVAAALAETGAFVIDADAVGHALLDQTPSREEVVVRFGEEVFDKTAPADAPRIDRRALGRIVFAEPNSPALRALERILHPRMRKTFERAIARAVRLGRVKAVVLDAAILLEAGWDDLCDKVAFVEASQARRLARLAESRGWKAETLEARERSQLPLDQKRARADFVIANDGGPEALAAGVQAFWRRLSPPRRSTATPHPAVE